jgi:diguanylate cyclase (GGDEF)-like protein
MADRRKCQKKEGFVERRARSDRRKRLQAESQWRYPGWNEQRLQYITRYVLLATGLVYFNRIFEYNSTWMSLTQLNLYLCGYFLFVTISFMYARARQHSPLRFRVAMWVDIISVSIGVLNDPFVVPLSSMVYIIIVLGNGMRYSMRLFSEALIGSFAAAMSAITFRYTGSVDSVSSGVIFLYIFAAMILVYAYILMHRIDITHRSLQKSSRLDHLTGLFNRNALMDTANVYFDGLKADRDRVIVMFTDLDKFKDVNDTMGHAVGDRVLVEVSNIIKNSIRDYDIAARYGGDEFVLIINDIDMQKADEIGRRIQESVRRWGQKNDIHISVSIGIGEAPRHGNSLDDVLELVDRALYHSKSQQGSGGICNADIVQA